MDHPEEFGENIFRIRKLNTYSLWKMYKIQQTDEEESSESCTLHSKITTIWGFVIPNFLLCLCISVCTYKGKEEYQTVLLF